MPINKVDYFGRTLIDLTDDTVTSETVMEGMTAHNKQGEIVRGTFTIENELTDQEKSISAIKDALNGKAMSKPSQEKTVTIDKNGTVVVTPDLGKELTKVTIHTQTPEPKQEQEKNRDITENGTFVVEPDPGNVLSRVMINVDVNSGGGGTTVAEIAQGRIKISSDTVCTVDSPFIVSYELSSTPTFFTLFRIGEPAKGPGYNFYNVTAIQNGGSLSVNASYYAQYPEMYSFNINGSISDANPHFSPRSVMDVWGATRSEIKIGAIRAVVSKFPAGEYIYIVGREK